MSYKKKNDYRKDAKHDTLKSDISDLNDKNNTSYIDNNNNNNNDKVNTNDDTNINNKTINENTSNKKSENEKTEDQATLTVASNANNSTTDNASKDEKNREKSTSHHNSASKSVKTKNSKVSTNNIKHMSKAFEDLNLDSAPVMIKIPKGITKWPEQKVKLIMSKGIEFNVLCIGEPNCGKKSFIESIFDIREEAEPIESVNNEIKTYSYSQEEDNSKITINVSYTTNFNTTFDIEKDIKVLTNFLVKGDRVYLDNETKFEHSRTVDTRNHLVLYFLINKTKSLNDQQAKLLDSLRHYNILPVIAKSDTMTSSEKEELKRNFLEMVKSKNLKIIEFPEKYESAEINKEFNKLIPFSILGSKEFVDTPKGKVRARSYSYGLIEVDNPEHSDFTKIRQALIRHNFINLIQMANDGHYSEFRRSIFSKINIGNDKSPNSLHKMIKNINDLIKKRRQEGKNIKINYDDLIKEEQINFNKLQSDITKEFEKESTKLKDEIKRLEEQLSQVMEINRKKK